MKTSSFVTSAALSLVLGLSITGCSSKEERERKYLDRAQALIEEGDYVKARLELRNVVQINEKSAEAYYLRAQIYEKEDNLRKMMESLVTARAANPEYIPVQLKLAALSYDFNAALDGTVKQDMEKVLAVEPDNVEALVILGRVLNRQGNTEEAIVTAEKGIAVAPQNPEPVLLLAEIHKDDPARSLEIIDRGIASNPTSEELLVAKIRLLNAMGDEDQVVELYGQLVAAKPDNLEYYRSFMTYLNQVGRTEQVETNLREVIAKKPEVPEYKVWLTQLMVSNKRFDEAIDTAKGFLAEQNDRAVFYFLVSDVYLTMNDLDAALVPLDDYISNVSERSPDALKAKNRKADILQRKGDLAGARAELEAILVLDNENVDALIKASRFALAEGDTDSAILNLRSALKHEAESVEANLLLARAHEYNGSLDLALDSYLNALEYAPANMDVAMKVASMYRDREETELANRLLTRYLATAETAAVVAPSLVASYTANEEWTQAIEIAEQLQDQEKNNALGLYLMGGIAYERENYGEAITIFESLLEISPDPQQALSAIVKAVNAQSGIDDAIKYIQSYIEQHPREIPPREILAALYIEKGDKGKAQGVYDDALAAEPRNVSILISKSQLYQSVGDLEAALDTLNSALEVAPGNLNLLILKAGLLERSGKYENAVHIYEDILERQPANHIAANNLAMILVDNLPSEENTAKALKVTAHLDSAKEPVLMDTRGWVHYRAGNYEQARVILEAALLVPEKANPIYRYHLGMVYIQLGETEKAKEQLEASLKGEANYPGKEEAAAALAGLEP